MRAKKIFGPSLPILKGKTIRQAPKPVVSDYVAVPLQILTKNQDMVLTGDIFFINQALFLVMLSQNIRLTTAHYLKDRKPPTIAVALKQAMAVYAKWGFKVVQILMDGKFEPLCDQLNEAGIDLNIALSNEHMLQIK